MLVPEVIQLALEAVVILWGRVLSNLLLVLEVNHLERVGGSGVVFKQMLWHAIKILVALHFVTSVASLFALEVVVAAFATLPTTGWELALLLLFLGLYLRDDALLALITVFAALEVIVEALVAVPSSLWQLELAIFSISQLPVLLSLRDLSTLVNCVTWHENRHRCVKDLLWLELLLDILYWLKLLDIAKRLLQ